MAISTRSRRIGRMTLSLATVLALAVLPASAQNFMGGLGLTVGFPQGEFKHNVNGPAYGLAGTFGYAPASMPLMVGVKLGFMIYGHEARTEPFSTTIPDVRVDVTTSNNVVLAHGVFRLQPTQGTLQPYIQGIAGLSYFFTETRIENQNSPGVEVASSTNISDGVFSYGAGAGLMISLSSDPESGSVKEWLIDIGADYVRGGEAEYLKEGSIRREGGAVAFDTIRSRTDLIEVHVGVAVRF